LRHAHLTAAVLFALGATLLGSTGCATVDMPGVKCKLVKERSLPGDASSPFLYHVRFEGKGRSEPRFAVLWAPYALYGSFAGETHWSVDPERLEASNGAVACIEIDDLSDDTSTLEWFANLCGEYSAPSTGNEGITYEVSWNGVDGGTAFVPGARDFILRAEWDGAVLSFSHVDGFPRGVLTVLVDSGAYVNPGASFAATGVTRFPKQAVLRLEHESIVNLGGLPAGATPEQAVAHTIGEALHATFDAARLLNAPTLDYDGAEAGLAAAEASLATAAAELQGLSDPKRVKKAGRKLAQARKQVGKARAQIARQSQKSAVQKVRAAVKAATDAWNRVTPFLLTQ
jgi:hypothetical protein